jgi:hypothetical protein
VSNRFAASENLHGGGNITVAWEAVREHIKISPKNKRCE